MFKRVTTEQLKVPAHIDYLADLRDFITRVGRKHGFSDKVVNAFKLAIDEAGTNIIRHAYRGTSGYITIRAIVRKDSLTVALIDQGKYFDPRQVQDPDLGRYVSIGKKGGLGIFIIRKLMDEIDYHKTEEGNELRLTKLRDHPRPGRLRMPVSSAPLTLKAKYFLRISAVLTTAIAVGYFYYYQRHAQVITGEVLSEARRVIDLLSSSLAQNGRLMADDSGLDWIPEIQRLYRNFRRDTGGMVHRIFVVNRYGDVFVSSDSTDALWVKYALPADVEQVQPDVYRYQTRDGVEVFELSTRIQAPGDAGNVRRVHLQVDKRYSDALVHAARMEDLRLAILILLFANAGTAVLMYVLMNPFRKLAEWVRELGQGEPTDEMDIDATTEIGEIAQAFTDITKKFRESQKNLAEQERLQKEMQVAQEIQQTLLPVGFPDVEGYELASFYEAAKEVGGDYYDFVEVDKDTLGIAVADVSGKGVPGSLVMTMIRTALRTEARGVKDAAEVLAKVNEFVMDDMKRGMFVTVFYVIIDSKNRRLNYASAGHNPMILYRPSTNKTYYLNPKGFPIGIQLAERDLFRKSIESDTIRLAEDDILLIYTDGITEAMNPNRELFGEERLLQIVREYGRLPVEDFVEKVREEIQSFTEGNVQYDDITLVAIKERTSKEKEELRRAKEAHRLISAGQNIRDACKEAGITTYSYYSKYRKIFEEEGVQAYTIDEETSVEAKHLSIEEKTKIFDIIKNHPDYGAKRIQQELNSEKYGFTEIPEAKIYEELVRSRLNTRQLREAFVARGGRSGRRLKPPGTPLLTLDGKVILDRERGLPPVRPTGRPSPPERPIPAEREAERPIDEAPEPMEGPTTIGADIDAQALVTPLEELLDKRREQPPKELEDSIPEVKDRVPPTDDIDSESIATSGEEDEILSQLLEDVPGPETEDESQDEGPVGFEALLGLDSEDTESTPVGEPTDAEGPALDSSADTPDALSLTEEETPEEQAGADQSSDTDPLEVFATDELIEAEILKTFEAEEKALQARTGTEAPDETGDDAEADQAEAMLASLFAEDEEDAAAPAEGEMPETELSEQELDWDLEETATDIEEEQDDSFQEDVLAFEDVLDMAPDETAEETELPDSVPGDNLEVEEIEADSLTQTEDSGEDVFDLLSCLDAEMEPMAESISENGNRAVEEPAAAVPPESAEEQNTAAGFDQAEEPSSEDLDERERLLVSGLRFYRAKEYSRAIIEFRKIVEAYPDFKEAHSALGNAYFRNQMFREAEIAYQRVKELDPQESTAYENMGVIYANRGEYSKAVEEWERVLELSPDRTDIVQKIERVQRLVHSTRD